MDKVRPWTNEEKRPFTQDPTAVRVLDNIYCVAQVAKEESAPNFIGWIVQGRRPLALSKFTNPPAVVLGYGAGGTVFSNCQKAIDAAVDSYNYAISHGYSWFDPHEQIHPYGKLLIFSLVKP